MNFTRAHKIGWGRVKRSKLSRTSPSSGHICFNTLILNNICYFNYFVKHFTDNYINYIISLRHRTLKATVLQRSNLSQV